MRVCTPVFLRTFVRSYASGFNPKQTRKFVSNATLALCSKFKDTENREHVLSTSSLTCVTTQPQGNHVTHPFLFPKYYPRPQYDWVHKLTSSDVWATAQLIETGTGKLLHEIELGAPSDEMKIADLQKIVESKDVKVDVMKLYPNVPIIGQHLFYLGHNVDTSVNVAYPTDSTGIIVYASPEKIYASVENPPMPMGMCGGPVVLMQDMQQCIGIIEAAVAPLKKGDENNETKVFLQDKVVIIPSIVISKFLKDVDADLG